MAPSSRQADFVELDSLLREFLGAASPEATDRALVRLMEAATVLMDRCLKSRGREVQSDEIQETTSEARTQLILRLQRLRAERSGPSASGPASPAIADFGGYVMAVTRNAWAQHVRQRNPARAMLLNRLRYLLEGRTNQRGFAVWTGFDGKPWVGFEAARERLANSQTTAREGRLLADPRTMANEIFGATAWESLPLGGLVSGLLTWLDGPLRLRDLTGVVAVWQNIPAGRSGGLVIDLDDDESPAGSLATPGPSPHDELRWKESLVWLGREAAKMTLGQRRAFLLKSSCLREMEGLGLLSIRQAATLLELPPERLAEHWTSLPLEDRVIAAMLGLGTQQVINLRKAARTVLERARQQFLQEI